MHRCPRFANGYGSSAVERPWLAKVDARRSARHCERQRDRHNGGQMEALGDGVHAVGCSARGMAKRTRKDQIIVRGVRERCERYCLMCAYHVPGEDKSPTKPMCGWSLPSSTKVEA